MLQNNQLQLNAPNSLHLRYIPQDTGSPGFDFNNFAEQHGNRCINEYDLDAATRSAWRRSGEMNLYSGNASRIDVEETFIIGDGVIVRIEPDLASLDEKEAEAKIASVVYAEKVLGNNADAVEFIRCVKLLAGEDARGLDLQIIASHYYGQAKIRPVGEVLKEMALLAMELTSVTASEESRLLESNETEITILEEPMTVSDRRALSMRRAAEALGEVELTAADLFHLEVRARSVYGQAGHTQGFYYDDDSHFQAYMRDLSETTDDDALEAIQESYDRVSEQYDEGNVVSLHMSDGEKVVVLGTLDDDVTEDYLPQEARRLAGDLRRAFIGGEGAQAARQLVAQLHHDRAVVTAHRRFKRQGQQALAAALASIPDVGARETFSRTPLSEGEIAEWMDCATAMIYNRRVKRTARAAYTSSERNRLGRPTMFDAPYTIIVNPEGETRLFVQQVLETLLGQMKADFHLRAQRSNALYRNFHRRIRTARDTALVAATIKEAYQAKEEGRLSLALFTALNTSSKLQRWSLETERVSQACSRLLREIQSATAQKRMYLRWAMYGENQPAHPIHALPRQEKARVWDALKDATQMPTPMAA